MSHPAYPLSTLRCVPHGSSARLEAKWFAIPFLQGSFILSFMSVYPGALIQPFHSLPSADLDAYKVTVPETGLEDIKRINLFSAHKGMSKAAPQTVSVLVAKRSKSPG